MVAIAEPEVRYGLPVYQKQEDFFQSTNFITGFCAGRGSGKSYVGALKVLMTAKNGERWMAISPTYTVIEDTTWPTFREVCGIARAWISGVKSPTPVARFYTQDGGRAELVFRSADKPELLRGPSLPGMWYDEASVMHEDAFRNGLPSLRYKGRMGKCLLTFTPKGRRHWTFGAFYREVKEGEDRNGAVEIAGRYYRPKNNRQLIRAHTLENPFLAEEYYDLQVDNMTAAMAAQELAGDFIDLQGLIFTRGFQYVDAAPRRASRVRYWDRAATPGGGKYTAGLLLAHATDGLFYVEDVIRGQWSAAQRDQIIVETAYRDAKKYDNEVVIYAEQEGGSAGKEISEQFIRRLAGFPVYRDIVSGQRHRIVDKMEMPGEAKIIRAQPVAAQCEAGNVLIVRGPWNDEFTTELIGFPHYTFSDQVDAFSGAFNKLARANHGDPGEVSRPEVTGGAENFGLALLKSRNRRKGGL